MENVHFDPICSDDERRERLYGGDIFVFAPRPTSLALCDFAREMIQDAFGKLPAREAQYHMPVEQYVSIVAPLKPNFIHHPKTKQLMAELVEDLGCDLEQTYVDVTRLRMVTSDGYLTSGVGYAHPPHRDTWYSAPLSQLNFWLPIYDIEANSAMAFHPYYWTEPVRNSSNQFNYYAWNSSGRKDAATQIKTDTRKQPKALEPMQLQPEIRLVPPAGGIILFSGAQMHSTVPNTSGLTRYSIDFRTVHLGDLLARRGAPNLDAASTGTSVRDFRRGTDRAAMPPEAVALYDDGTMPEGGELVYQPPLVATH